MGRGGVGFLAMSGFTLPSRRATHCRRSAVTGPRYRLPHFLRHALLRHCGATPSEDEPCPCSRSPGCTCATRSCLSSMPMGDGRVRSVNCSTGWPTSAWLLSVSGRRRSSPTPSGGRWPVVGRVDAAATGIPSAIFPGSPATGRRSWCGACGAANRRRCAREGSPTVCSCSSCQRHPGPARSTGWSAPATRAPGLGGRNGCCRGELERRVGSGLRVSLTTGNAVWSGPAGVADNWNVG